MKLFESNPRYLEFRGKPTVLIGSGEHYGALLNLDFDFRIYLETLAKARLNLTRVFSGTYREIPGDFLIADNTLAPKDRRFQSPWVRRPDGKWDLSKFDPAYFERLHDLVVLASDRSIVVEFVLFCFWYGDSFWKASPMHPANNVQGIGPEDKEKVFDLADKMFLAYQEAFVRKIVEVTNSFDNLILEICNEPYSRHDHTAYEPWQRHIADVIREAESKLPNRHPIAQNIQNGTALIDDPHPGISIFNFHYATPEAVLSNRHLAKPIADDETGFNGQSAEPYRIQAWKFMLSGGASFDHLDYSFTCSHPDGTAPIQGETPGYGGKDLRDQLSYLKRFLQSIEPWRMAPHNEVLCWGAEGVVLADPGRIYTLYLDRPGAKELGLGLPRGRYRVRFLSPVECRETKADTVDHPGGALRLHMPDYSPDLAVTITADSTR